MKIRIRHKQLSKSDRAKEIAEMIGLTLKELLLLIKPSIFVGELLPISIGIIRIMSLFSKIRKYVEEYE